MSGLRIKGDLQEEWNKRRAQEFSNLILKVPLIHVDILLLGFITKGVSSMGSGLNVEHGSSEQILPSRRNLSAQGRICFKKWTNQATEVLKCHLGVL